MPIQPFGQADPIYDSLRVPSNQSIWNGPNDSGNTGGGLENKIYLWPSDASTISTYDPTEAGLDAAITAAAAGDTIWLPSIEIACTTQKTIPASVALRGISHKATLNFSGFAGACIVLSADSIIQDFTLNHADGKWFDASADGSKALRIHGTAYRALTGISLAPVVSEIWAGELDGVYWLSGGNWNKVASNPDANSIHWAGMANDGSTLYVATSTSGHTYDTIMQKLYKCTNPKAVSPTWNLILQVGDSVAGAAVNTFFSYTIGPMVLQGNNLYTLCHINASNDAWAYGVYNGSAWTWTRTTDYSTTAPGGVGKDTYMFNSDVREGGTNTLIIDYGNETDGYELYKNASKRYVIRKHSSNLYISDTATDLQNFGSSTQDVHAIRTKVTGPETSGSQVYVVTANDAADGHLWISDDGSSFSDIVTWTQGWARDDAYNGGGDLIWLALETADAATILRRYTRAGSVDADLTGNFWSVAPAGVKRFKGLSLVFA